MSETERYRIMVVAGDPVLRAGLVLLLADRPDLEVVAETGDGRRAVETAWELVPDVVLLDGGPRGATGVGELSRLSRVIMLAPRADPGLVLAAIRDGAVGYLLHGTLTGEELAAAIRDTMRNNAHPLAPAATAALVAAARGTGPAPIPECARAGFGLSARETDVMRLIAQGRTNSDIAAELVLAEKSVKNYINRIYAKLGARNRATAIIIWLGAGPPVAPPAVPPPRAASPARRPAAR
ncbi:LuxR C-terminal-related transcriptional regulator [Actinomadura sp. 21ATH]|uniref:LuxR C-terminal-related transcriptional regulator n=1 Tax=Actinomadura sp. 21ATH TaxID=1735444 RepID=UPI0035BF03D6